MKHQGMKDRMHERDGMMAHGGRAHGQYENEVEKPAMPSEGHMMRGEGLYDFKGECDPIAYGQASTEGCKADEKRLSAQFKDYHWD